GTSDEMHITPRVERLIRFEKLAPGHTIITAENDALYDRIETTFRAGAFNGIILANDFAFMPVVEYANKVNLDLDADDMIAIDDSPLASVYRPRISTIAQSVEEIAKNAHSALMHMIEAEVKPDRRVHSYKGKIMERWQKREIPGVYGFNNFHFMQLRSTLSPWKVSPLSYLYRIRNFYVRIHPLILWQVHECSD